MDLLALVSQGLPPLVPEFTGPNPVVSAVQ